MKKYEKITPEQIEIIKKLYTYGFTKEDIAAKLVFDDVSRIARIVFKHNFKQGVGFIKDLPDELKNTKKDEVNFLSIIKRHSKVSCKEFCSKKCELCQPKTCQIRTTKEFFFERLIRLVKISDLMMLEAKRRYYEKMKQKREVKPIGRPRKNPIILKIEPPKVDLSVKYQDLPAWQVRELDAKTAEHNQKVGFDPRKIKHSTPTHSYGNVWDSF